MEAHICLKCGGVLKYVENPLCPVCEIPMRPWDEDTQIFNNYVCNTCGVGFDTYDDTLSHFCDGVKAVAIYDTCKKWRCRNGHEYIKTKSFCQKCNSDIGDTHTPQSTAGGFTSPLGDPTGNITSGQQEPSGPQMPDGTSADRIPVSGNGIAGNGNGCRMKVMKTEVE